jgi:hypothetical protein
MSATCDMGGAGGRATDRLNAVLPRPTTRSVLKTAEMRVRGHRLPVRALDCSEAAPVENVRQVGGSVRALVDAGHGMWQAESRRVRRSYYHGEPSVRLRLEQTWAARASSSSFKRASRAAWAQDRPATDVTPGP